MRPTKCLCIKHSFALIGMAALLWIGNPAIAQSAQPQDRDTTTRQLSSFDAFLDGHPEIAEQLHKNPSLVRDEEFIENHPALQDYLQQHPGVREEISENPDSFMRQEQRFDRRENRRELANLDGFLDSHPEIAGKTPTRSCRRSSASISTKAFGTGTMT